jgi:ribose 5-phosphate isomerase A
MQTMDSLKRQAAERAVQLVKPGMRLGLGTGSTAKHFVELLGERVAGGLMCVGVPTSEETARLAQSVRVPLTTLDETPELDLTVDGADELDGALRLIKGGGAALLREKIVAAASRRMVVIADESKRVETLGRFPLPIEVNRFGLAATLIAIARATGLEGRHGSVTVRLDKAGEPLVTDGGHLIVDARLERIDDPEGLARRLCDIPGVVEHGLFIGLAHAAILAGPGGITVIGQTD